MKNLLPATRHIVTILYIFKKTLANRIYLAVYFSLFVLTQCVIKPKETIRIEHEGEFTIKARTIDGKADGKSEYYKSGILTGIITYKNDIKNGLCIHYFKNGTVADSVEYVNDKEEGYWRHYNPDGSPLHFKYYYAGLAFGPDLWYDSNKVLRHFQFFNFDRKPIVQCSYEKHGQLDSIQIFELTAILDNKADYLGAKSIGLFAYLPQIPLAKELYYIGLEDQNKTRHKLCNIKGDNYLIDTVLNTPPPGLHYYLGCDSKTDDGGFPMSLNVDITKK